MSAHLTWDQLLIVLCGVTAIYLAQSPRESARRWAPIFGLLGQPGWLYAAWQASQLGVFIVALLYTGAWLRGLWVHWGPRRRSGDVLQLPSLWKPEGRRHG